MSNFVLNVLISLGEAHYEACSSIHQARSQFVLTATVLAVAVALPFTTPKRKDSRKVFPRFPRTRRPGPASPLPASFDLRQGRSNATARVMRRSSGRSEARTTRASAIALTVVRKARRFTARRCLPARQFSQCRGSPRDSTSPCPCLEARTLPGRTPSS
jgi:hypothetical protein